MTQEVLLKAGRPYIIALAGGSLSGMGAPGYRGG
jgi:hypothetical protein